VNVAKVAEVGAVSRLIHTRVGDGPRVLDEKEVLLAHDGSPVTTSS
jgi:diphosphomevalonate decarboxylase